MLEVVSCLARQPYEFDADGKVIKTIVVSDTGVTSEITYEYTCG
jgi:hypothetical protein